MKRFLTIILLFFLSILTISSFGQLITFYIEKSLCISCGQCISVCPVKAISIDWVNYKAIIDPMICIRCGACALVCPTGAARPLFAK